MRKIWLLLLIFALVSCRDANKVREPENLIPENKMVEVLTDLSLLNSAKNYNRRQLENTGLRPVDYLYNRHGIDSVSLSQSTRYYANYPADLERIYTRVKNNLERLKSDLEDRRDQEGKTSQRDTVLQIQQNGDSVYVNPEIFKRESRDTLPPGLEVDYEEATQ